MGDVARLVLARVKRVPLLAVAWCWKWSSSVDVFDPGIVRPVLRSERAGVEREELKAQRFFLGQVPSTSTVGPLLL